MALIHSKKQTGLGECIKLIKTVIINELAVVSNTELARPTYQTSNIRTGTSEDPVSQVLIG